jgi:signal peptidase I
MSCAWGEHRQAFARLARKHVPQCRRDAPSSHFVAAHVASVRFAWKREQLPWALKVLNCSRTVETVQWVTVELCPPCQMRLSRTRTVGNTGFEAKPNGRVRGRLQRETRQGYILLCMALWSVISFLLISNFVVSTVTITGVSMVPTLYPEQIYLLNRWSHRLFPPSYGDLVVVRDRVNGEMLVKRVIALPHDIIDFKQGRVFLNGHPLRESYLPAGTYTSPRQLGRTPCQLDDNQFFVMGDNRAISEDSRSHGPVRRGDILGTISH